LEDSNTWVKGSILITNLYLPWFSWMLNRHWTN